MLSVLMAIGVVVQSVTFTPQQAKASLRAFGQQGDLNPVLPIQVQGFDTSLGTLLSVQAITNFTPTFQLRLENESSSPAPSINWHTSVQPNLMYDATQANPFNYSFTFAGGQGITGVTNFGTFTGQYGQIGLLPYDGTTDFAGTSGVTLPQYGPYTYILSSRATSQRELRWWSQPVSRTLYLCPRVYSESMNGFPGHWNAERQVDMNFSQILIIRYEYATP